MQNNKSNKFAFSLIELSVVILIIGILVIGITRGSSIINKSKLQSARSLTQGSPVNSTEDIIFWYDSVHQKGVQNDNLSYEIEDGDTVEVFIDQNPQLVTKNSAINTTTSSQPLYVENGINGLPTVRFDGSNDFLGFSGTNFANSGYSVFVVEKRNDTADNNYFIGGTTTSSLQNLHLGYRTNQVIKQSHYGNELQVQAADGLTAAQVPRIHSFLFNSSRGQQYNLNNKEVEKTEPTYTSEITSYGGSAIARIHAGNYAAVDISEIIAFKRMLKESERLAITEYLSKKYNINLSY